MQNSQAEIGWAHQTLSSAEKQLPDRLDNLDEVLAILPSQADCETLFEYILQEASMLNLLCLSCRSDQSPLII
jgi:hypothetical protein